MLALRAALAGRLAAGLLALSGGLPAAEALAKDPVTAVDDTTVELNDDAMANLTITPVAEKEFPEVLTIMGTISPVENRVSSVPARVAGRIDSVLKVTGEYVQAGEALALEYSPDFIQTRQEYLEAMKRDSSGDLSGTAEPSGNSDFSNLAAISHKKLENMGLIAKDFDDLGNTAADHTHLVIRASHSGAITTVSTSVGNMQNQGDTLMTISDLDRVWFTGDLYSEDLTKVHSGQEIKIQTEGLSRPLDGRISFISPVIDANAHTIKIRAMIENPDRALRGSMVVQGDIILSRKKALVVPVGSLMNLYGEWRVFKQVGHNRFKEVPVQEGQEYDDEATVVQGLQAGDVVVSGGDLVMDFVFSAN